MYPDHVTLICPVCEREGTVHESLVCDSVRVVCSGGKRETAGKWSQDGEPHEPTVCVPLRDG